ncbi:glycosyltransferase [Sphingomonas hengshuiensis]|nr:glycosyltransferase [Sphingomonas hengshuiensis]
MSDPNGKLVGWFGSTKHGISGWIANTGMPGLPIEVELYFQGELAGKTIAREPREKLAERGLGSVHHGFSFPLPIGAAKVEEQGVELVATQFPELRFKPGSFRQAVEASKAVKQEPLEAVNDAEHARDSSGPAAVDTAAVAELKEQIEKLVSQNKRLRRFLDARKAEAEAQEAGDPHMARLISNGTAAVSRAVAKLWGGHSATGRSELLALANGNWVAPQVRATAAYELARLSADAGKPHHASRLMAQARRADRSLMRRLRPRLLEADLLCRIGNAETALARLDKYVAEDPTNPNFLIGRGNARYALGDRQGQLSDLNRMFANGGLTPIGIADADEPFLSLQATAASPINDGPKVSVLISTYNAAEYLRLAIGSIQNQTWRNLEILVTDDCSTDDSLRILAEIAAEDPRVTVFENPANKGTYANRNAMFQACTGEFVTSHDADDWSHPQMIEHQVRHLVNNESIKINTTMGCRVTRDLRFMLRLHSNNSDFCMKNYAGFMMRKRDIGALGGWDATMAAADSEFLRRVIELYGKEAEGVVNPDTVYSSFLLHENSLTQQETTNLKSLTFGSRKEYRRQSQLWSELRRNAAADEDPLRPFAMPPRTSRSDPFPAPNSLLPPALKSEVLAFDVLIVSELNLPGGTRGCNLNYIKALRSIGLRVALFDWPRADRRHAADIDRTYRLLKQQGDVEIVTWEDSIAAKRVIVHDPAIAVHMLDRFPKVQGERVALLVNQLPFETIEREASLYDPQSVDRSLRRLFNVSEIEWIATSPLTRRYLAEYADVVKLSPEIWFPPYAREADFAPLPTAARLHRIRSGAPSFARHTRDHWTKWPSLRQQARSLYMADANLNFSVLGGDRTISGVLGELPSAWRMFANDSIPTDDLLRSADIYLNFNNEVYIEEFGRNMMEAMAHGVPVIGDAVFTENFGDAILFPEDGSVEKVVARLCDDRSVYEAQAERGLAFVRDHCSMEAVQARLLQFIA